MTVLHRGRWVMKPPESAQLDPGHQLAARMVGLWLPNGIAPPTNRLTGRQSSAPTGLPSQGGTPDGVGAAQTANTQYYELSGSGGTLAGTSNWSIFSRFLCTSSTIGNNGPPVYCERAAVGNDILSMRTPWASGGAESGVGLTLRDDAGTLLVNQGTGVAVLDKKIHSALVTFSLVAGTATWKIYQDGRLLSSGSGAYGNAYTNSLVTRMLADPADGTNSWGNVVVPLVATWKRTLTADEARWLHTEPYAFMQQPRPKRLLMTASSALTGSASSTVTASVTSAGSTGVTTGGTLAAAVALVAAGVVGISGAANSTDVTATTTAAGSTGLSTGGSLTNTATVTAAGATGTSQGGSATVTATLTATGATGAAADASSTVTVTLTAGGVVAASTGAAAGVTAALTADGTVTADTGASLTVTATVTATGSVTSTGTATSTATATLTAAGHLVQPPRDITVTSVIGGDRWAHSIGGDRWGATAGTDRWASGITQEAQ